MLTIKENNDSKSPDNTPRRSNCSSSLLYDFLKVDKALEEYASHLPKLREWNLSELRDQDGFEITFSYELNQKKLYFSLPIFNNLKDKSIELYLGYGENSPLEHENNVGFFKKL